MDTVNAAAAAPVKPTGAGRHPFNSPRQAPDGLFEYSPIDSRLGRRSGKKTITFSLYPAIGSGNL